MAAARVAAVLLIVLSAMASAGQTFGGSVTITVFDPTGAVIPDARIYAHAQPDRIVAQTQTDSDGVARLNLPAGSYTITVRRGGFSVWMEKDVEVRNGFNRRVSASLRLAPYSGPVLVAPIKPPFNIETFPLPLIPQYSLKLFTSASR